LRQVLTQEQSVDRESLVKKSKEKNHEERSHYHGQKENFSFPLKTFWLHSDLPLELISNLFNDKFKALMGI